MAIDLTLKSTNIANREASPRVLANPGWGGTGSLRTAYGYIASVTASLSATSVIRFVDVPSNCVVTSVKVSSGAQTAGKFNIGVYNTNANGGLVAVTGSDAFFTTDLDCASAVADTQVCSLATTLNTIANRALPLWKALGLAADPGGRFDICATVHTTAVTTGTGALAIEVVYTV
jgi:hypothetical protein